MPSDKQNWDNIQLDLGASFVQSNGWALFQEQYGHKSFKLHGKDWSCLLLYRKTPIGSYLFAPYGPTCRNVNGLAAALESIKTLGEKQKVDWLRIEPVIKNETGKQWDEILSSSKATPAPRNVEPPLTRIVDISVPEEQILSGISSSTRSLIRKNIRENMITFRSSTNPEDMSLFFEMMNTVADRKGVGFHPYNYLLLQAKVLMPLGQMRIEFALDEGKPVAGIVVHDFGATASYTYAASFPEARKKSAAALLVWQAMLNAKNRGMKSFDLFGIAADDVSQDHPWYGFTSFKRKFGGTVVPYIGTWDMPLSPKYRIYLSLLKVKKLLKH